MIDQGIHHPKMHDLAESLEITRSHAVGIMECLWKTTKVYAPRGDIGAITNRAIARAVDWRGDPDILIHTLRDVGFLDEMDAPVRLYIHDWHEHADDWTDRYLFTRGMSYANGLRPTGRGLSRTQRENYAHLWDDQPSLPHTGDSSPERPAVHADPSASNQPISAKRGGAHRKTPVDWNAFDQFWASYPRRVNKGRARKSWEKLHPTPALTSTILDAVRAQSRPGGPLDSEQDFQFIPHPATWLNGERWEDEPPPPPEYANEEGDDISSDVLAAAEGIDSGND